MDAVQGEKARGARGCSKTSSVGNIFCLGSICSFLHIVLGIFLFFFFFFKKKEGICLFLNILLMHLLISVSIGFCK